MKPYYQDDLVTLYHSDAKRILPFLEPMDLLLTDPPYGIGADANQMGRAGKRMKSQKAFNRDYGASDWDSAPPEAWLLEWARSVTRYQIIFGGNFFELPPASCWLVWDKENTAGFADCELAWTNLDKAVRRLRYCWNGMIQEDMARKEVRQHPTQKPEAVIRWALSQAPEDAKSVFDPFCGSGTTLVEAKRLGLSAIGVEINEAYCEIAANRLRQGSLSALFQP